MFLFSVCRNADDMHCLISKRIMGKEEARAEGDQLSLNHWHQKAGMVSILFPWLSSLPKEITEVSPSFCATCHLPLGHNPNWEPPAQVQIRERHIPHAAQDLSAEGTSPCSPGPQVSTLSRPRSAAGTLLSALNFSLHQSQPGHPQGNRSVATGCHLLWLVLHSFWKCWSWGMMEPWRSGGETQVNPSLKTQLVCNTGGEAEGTVFHAGPCSSAPA